MKMRNAEMTRQRILEAAENEFAAKGLYGARVDEIAKRAQVNKRMIYEYFGGKEPLYTAVLVRAYNRVVDMEKQVLTENLPASQAIRTMMTRYFFFLREDPNFVKLIMWENLNEGKYIQAAGAPIIKDFGIKASRRFLEAGIREGLFRENVDIEEIILSFNMFAFSYFSNIHTMTQLMHDDYFRPERIQKRADFVARLLTGYLSAN